MARSAAVSRKRRKAPLTSDAKSRCSAKRKLTQPSQLSQSIAYTVSVINETCDVRPGQYGHNRCQYERLYYESVRYLFCKQLTSSTSIGTDSLQCCMCGLIFHGECPTIKSTHLPYLYIVMDIGVWCCIRYRSVVCKR